ncbi:hypothetical protein EGW08_012808 [Elysia chlorotica]|uniref:Thioredoxin peroxidase n=1 Tax=Elysia chlorotica TaxID=188477 RepID=A0A433TCT7_ELYCH|nr:hypothetical protein EGW08_012808 [Elysia chlorotica]
MALSGFRLGLPSNKNLSWAAVVSLCKREIGSGCSYLVKLHEFAVFIVTDTLGRHLAAARVQHPAPDFKAQAVVDGQFKELKLSDFKGKYLVLFFYPLDFTFVCPTEIIAFSENIDKFKAINTEVVGVSTDSHFSHLAWINTPRKQGGLGGLEYPLLADFNKTISADYDVLLKDGVALRGLFIIDPKGVVRQITINDLPVGRSVDETLRLIQAFQFVEEHGEGSIFHVDGTAGVNIGPINRSSTVTKIDCADRVDLTSWTCAGAHAWGQKSSNHSGESTRQAPV